MCIRDRRSKIETVEHVTQVIRSGRPYKPFKVVDMSERFFDFDKASDTYINTENLQIATVSWLKVCKDNPGYVLIKKNFSEVGDWEKCYVL